jgi:hypothetical protein
MRADMEEAKKLSWITRSFDNSGSRDDFLKKAALYVVF